MILHFYAKLSAVVKLEVKFVVVSYCEPLELVTFVDLIMLVLLGNLKVKTLTILNFVTLTVRSPFGQICAV